MKICLINCLYKPFNVGGAEKVVETIAETLSNEGHDVRVLTIGADGFAEKMIGQYKVVYLENKFIYHRVNSANQSFLKKIIWHWQNIFSSVHAKQVDDYFLQWQPDLVWTHNLSGFGWQIVEVIKKYKLKHWHEIHDFQLINPLGTFLYKQKDQLNKLPLHLRVYSLLAKKIFQDVGVVISPSDFLLRSYKNFNFFKNGKTIVLPNPVVLLNQTNQEVSKDGDSVNFLYVGQLEEHKGIGLLLNVFSQIANPNIKLVIIGDGSMMDYCKKYASADSRVSVVGKVESSNLSKYFSTCDVVIYPSECFENMPTVVAEANLCGKLVLASNIGGISEMIINNLNGWLVTVGDETAWIKAIKNILENPAQLQFDTNKIKAVAQKYEISEFSKKINELLKL